MTSSTSSTTTDVRASLNVIEVKPGLRLSEQVLKTLLPDVKTALFFGKAYELDYNQLSALLTMLFQTGVMTALFGEGNSHSSDLQDYIVSVVPDEILAQQDLGYVDDAAAPDSEILTAAVEEARVVIAQSIKDVATKLGGVLDRFPSKYGEMTFQHLHKFNAQRASIGQFAPVIGHQRTGNNLVVLDVSGSMTESTIRRIVDEVVGLAYDINAYLAIVSDSAFLYEPGHYTSATVLRDAEYSGTHYEELVPIFHQDWSKVITIADYDSSRGAKYAFTRATGRIGEVLDFSLVNCPTFLAECVGQLADTVTPVLTGHTPYVLR